MTVRASSANEDHALTTQATPAGFRPGVMTATTGLLDALTSSIGGEHRTSAAHGPEEAVRRHGRLGALVPQPHLGVHCAARLAKWQR
jgi:hypothetical protein